MEAEAVPDSTSQHPYRTVLLTGVRSYNAKKTGPADSRAVMEAFGPFNFLVFDTTSDGDECMLIIRRFGFGGKMGTPAGQWELEYAEGNVLICPNAPYILRICNVTAQQFTIEIYRV